MNFSAPLNHSALDPSCGRATRDIVVRGMPSFFVKEIKQSKSQDDFISYGRRRAAGISGDGEASTSCEAVCCPEQCARLCCLLQVERRRSLHAVHLDFAVRHQTRFPERQQRLASSPQNCTLRRPQTRKPHVGRERTAGRWIAWRQAIEPFDSCSTLIAFVEHCGAVHPAVGSDTN